MELIGIIGKNTYPLTVEKLSDHRYRVRVEEREYEVDARELSPQLYSILHGDQSHEVRLHQTSRNQDELEVEFHSHSVALTMTDPMSMLMDASGSGGRKGGGTLEAAMPGKVQRILVKEGDQVEEDQGLLVLVAMKMENELGSPSSGTVKKILVNEGDSVEGGSALIVIE